MYTQNIPLVISDAVKSNANATWNLIDSDTGGFATFSVPLSPSGAANATHWGTNTILEVECFNALRGHDNGNGTFTPLTNAEFNTFLQARSTKLGRLMPNNPGQFRAQFFMGTEGQGFDDFLPSRGLQRVAVPMEAQIKK